MGCVMGMAAYISMCGFYIGDDLTSGEMVLQWWPEHAVRRDLGRALKLMASIGSNTVLSETLAFIDVFGCGKM